MINFKNYFIISEKIDKTDIIDLYILMAMPTPDDPAAAFIANDVVRKTKSNITSEIEGILLRELRHLNDEVNYGWHPDAFMTKNKAVLNKNIKWLMDPEDPDQEYYREEAGQTMKDIFGSKKAMTLQDFVKGFGKTLRYLRDKYGEEGTNKYTTSEVTIGELAAASDLPWTVDAVANAFRNLEWSGGYGGDNWATIAKQAKLLIEAGSGELFEKLDRFIDYVHNSGPVLNKFMGYREGWLKFILDLKAQALNIRELIPYASRDVQKLFRDSAWRIQLRKIPGFGYQETDDVLKKLLIKAFSAATKQIIDDANSYGEDWFYNRDLLDFLKQYHVNQIIRVINPQNPDVMNVVAKFKKAAVENLAKPWTGVLSGPGGADIPMKLTRHIEKNVHY